MILLDLLKNITLYITPNIVDRLLAINQKRESYYFYPDDPVNREIVDFMNRTIIDGRYTDEWFSDPALVAYNLGLYVSPSAINRLNEMDLLDIIDTDTLFFSTPPGRKGSVFE